MTESGSTSDVTAAACVLETSIGAASTVEMPAGSADNGNHAPGDPMRFNTTLAVWLLGFFLSHCTQSQAPSQCLAMCACATTPEECGLNAQCIRVYVDGKFECEQ